MEAIKDLWFIGDKFVTDTYHTIQDIQKRNRLDKRGDLFIQEEFNLRCFSANPLSLIRNTATRMINALIKALDERNQLPRLIVIIPYDDLARFLACGLSQEELYPVTEVFLEWMITTMIRAIQSKKDLLIARKLGSVMAGEPKIIWAKMLTGSFRNNLPISKAFNTALNNVLIGKKNYFLMDVEKELRLADHKGVFDELSPDGVNKFWREINRITKRFEYGEISLKPFNPAALNKNKYNKYLKDNRKGTLQNKAWSKTWH